MGRMWKLITFILIALFALIPAYSQEEEDNGFNFGMSLGIGVATFDEDGSSFTYQSLSLSPDFSYGKFGLGFDITLNYTFTGPPPSGTDFYVREDDWIPSGDNSFLDVYLPKFKYIRYGFKGDPLFVKLGSIDDATLGNGFIMANYDNTLFLPEKRIFGLSFDLDGSLFNLPLVGIETFVGNLAQFDVIGVRPFVRPLINTELPVVKNLQFGATLAVDTKPALYVDETADETVALYGADFRLPLISKEAVTMATFGDLAFLHEQSMGGMVGFGGRLIGFLNYGAQIRILGENFVPTYFDSAYDLYRYEKYLIAKGGAEIPGYVGWLISLGTTFFDDAFIFNASLDGPFNKPEPDNEDNYLNYPHLYAIFMIKQGLVPYVSFDASYDKRSIKSFGDLVDAENSVIQARINYSIGPAVISFIYKIRYEPVSQDWVVTSGLASSIQLF